MSESLLSVRRLVTTFETEHGAIRPVDEVSFDVHEGETVALVGESGCGKSVTALSLMRLVAEPGRVAGGNVIFRGVDLLSLSEREMRAFRGAKIAMVFQEPMTSLNPVYRVGSQIAEVVRIHRGLSRRAARERAIEMLQLVGIPSPELRADAYPHELSGGMRQRVMIAMALACEPALLVADEPTTALDVTIQAQILDLLGRLQQKLGMGILFITHDLGVVAEFADRVVVMYAGRVVECGEVAPTFHEPLHPYTRGLLGSVPPMDASKAGKPRRLQAIEGMVPDLRALPAGCRYADRCALRRSEPAGYERCDTEEPDLSAAQGERRVRCYYPGRAA